MTDEKVLEAATVAVAKDVASDVKTDSAATKSWVSSFIAKVKAVFAKIKAIF